MKKATRRKFAYAFKAKVVLEAIKNDQTLAEFSKKFEVHPVMIAKWKSEFLELMSIVFKAPDEKESEDNLDTRELFVQQRSIHEGK
jgi:transposase-like protein